MHLRRNPPVLPADRVHRGQALVSLACAAQVDETRHAELCFGIASAYAGRSLGPGPLCIDGSLAPTSLEQIVLNTIQEGCIGETLAALEAAEARERASCAAVREVLAGIAQDELRHAELAWRFLRWALAQGGEPLARTVEAAFDAAALACSTLPERLSESEERLLSAGVLPAALRTVLRSEALSNCILPCARRLLDEVAGRPTTNLVARHAGPRPPGSEREFEQAN